MSAPCVPPAVVGRTGSAVPLLLGRPERHLAGHLALFGPMPWHPLPPFSRIVAASGLRGRGGGGRPVADKLDAVLSGAGGRRPVVVVNCCEADATSGKDAALVASASHLVLDGALAIAGALGAERVVVAARRGTAQAAVLTASVAERTGAGARVPIAVVEVPARYLASESSALVNFLNTGDARPRGPFRPIARQGVDGAPTLVHNAETLAQLALLLRTGPEAFAAAGIPDDPGRALVTVGGAVGRPGVFEVPYGADVSGVLQAGGAPRRGWVLVGGLSGGWARIEALAGVPLSHRGLGRLGLPLGVASFTVLAPGGCVLTETARILAYLADVSARQCGPCMFGLPTIAADVAALAGGDASAFDRLGRRLPVIRGRGGCSHPDGAVALASSALTVITGNGSAGSGLAPEHLQAHLRGGWCGAPVTVPLLAEERRR